MRGRATLQLQIKWVSGGRGKTRGDRHGVGDNKGWRWMGTKRKDSTAVQRQARGGSFSGGAHHPAGRIIVSVASINRETAGGGKPVESGSW